MAETKPTVFVVDDESAMREAFTCLLEAEGLEVRTYESGEAFLAAYQPRQPGCLLLDVRMRGMSGLQLQARLAQMEPTLPVIIITGHGDISMAVQGMKAGAMDFLEKPVNDKLLVERVRLALEEDDRRGREWQQRNAIATLLASLTVREQQVLPLVVRGLPSKQIATKLGITQKTVEAHRKHILDKMGVHNTPALVRVVTAAGLTL